MGRRTLNDVIVETRFAPGPGGPLAYRRDGRGGRWLIVVPDRTDPYGPPGAAAYGSFVAALAERGWTVLTLLDGKGPGAGSGDEAGTDARITAIRAVAEACGASRATVLGVGEGAVPAALSVAAAPEWASRLVLYGRFGGEAARADWAPAPAAGEQASVPVLRVKPADREKVAAELREARDSLQLARDLWSRWRAGRGGASQLPAVTDAADGGLASLADLIPREGRFAGLGELVRRPERWEGGLEELIRQVSAIEGAGEGTGDLLSRIAVPTVVADMSGGAADAAGFEIAARIPGARHLDLRGEPELPWTEAGPRGPILALLDEGAGAAAPPSAPSAARILATLLFTDIVASTERLTELGDAAWAELLQRHHAVVRGALSRFGGEEIDNAGDGFLASFPTPAPAIRCALAAIGELATIGLAIRCGLHTGECERIGGKLGGIAVHIGARIAGRAGAGEVLVSGTVHDLVAGSGIGFAALGTSELKGLPGSWPIFRVTGVEGEDA
jgi:class 3 adenylate cyclase